MQKIKCLFGHHKYTVPAKDRPGAFMCEYCMRFGYWKIPYGNELWLEWDESGELIWYGSKRI